LSFCTDDDDDDAAEASNTTTRHHHQNNYTSYMYVRSSRVVGFLQTEPIAQAYVLLSPTERSRRPQAASVGVHLLWVHAQHRRTGIATQLLNAIRLEETPVVVAFSSPSQAGIHFAKGWYNKMEKDGSVLVYDCGSTKTGKRTTDK